MKSIKIYTVLIAVLFLSLFNSCVKEESYIEDIKQNRLITKKIVSSDEIKENIKISDFLVKYNNKKEKNTSKSIIHDSINDFYIDTDEAIYLEEEGYHSYTFLIYRSTYSTLLENLVLSLNIDNSYDAYLWQYPLDDNGEIGDISAITVTQLEGFDSGVLFTPKTNPCINNLRLEIDYQDGDGNVYDNASDCGDGCTVVFHYEPCGTGSGGSGDGGTGDNGSGDNGSGDNGGSDYGGSDYGGSDYGGIDYGGSTDYGSVGNGSVDNNNTGGNDSSPVVTTPKNPDGSSATANFLINVIDIHSSIELNREQLYWINNPYNETWILHLNSFMSQEGTSIESINFVVDVIDFLRINNWKDSLRQAIANGITSTAEITHQIYKELSELAIEYPFAIDHINDLVDEFRDIADELFDTNPSTLEWLDLFGIWLFELGTYTSGSSGIDTINFGDGDVTTESLKQQEGVILARQDAIGKINNNDIASPVNRGWSYGQGEFYDGIANGNIATSFLGSYNTNVVITQNEEGSYTLTFTVSNPSTWESATRLRIDNDNNGQHDGIFPNTTRGDGNNDDNTDINIGGTIYQLWTWSEIVN